MRWLGGRVASAIALLWFMATLVFFTVRIAPGGPFDGERVFPPEIQAAILRQYDLDRPVWEQYLRWLSDVLHGDFHESFQYLGQPVTGLIASGLGVSAQLGLGALLLSLGIGVPLGALAGSRPGSGTDVIARGIAIAGVSLPSYVLASALVLVFALKLGWLPPALWESDLAWVLPTVTLAARPLALIARLTRSSVMEALQADYTRTARSKGLPEWRVVYWHALRNSLLPVLALMGPLTATLVTGSFLIEVVFQVPGVGKYFVSSVINRDYPLLMAITLLYGALLVACNLAVDVGLGWLDPRIRIQGEHR